MKNNKLFNKVLSKSGMLLVVTGVAMSSGAVSNIYAQQITTTTGTNAKCIQNSCSSPSYTGTNCNSHITVTIKPIKPNCSNTNCPSTNTPSTNTPSTNTPSTNTPSTNTPSTNTPSTNTPSTNTPSTNTPSTNTPNIDNTQTPSENVSNQTAFENEVLRLVNVERTKQGLNPLQMDESIRQVARAKATDMYRNNYFDHTSPTYGSPFDMLKQYGISYKSAGENIAKGQTTPQEVVNSWMNSPGHRANILNAKYTHIGIGYEANGNEWVQMFVGK